MAEKLLQFDFNQQGVDEMIPDDPGPAAAGKTPVLGSVRRSQGLPVLRDRLMEEV